MSINTEAWTHVGFYQRQHHGDYSHGQKLKFGSFGPHLPGWLGISPPQSSHLGIFGTGPKQPLGGTHRFIRSSTAPYLSRFDNAS